MVMEVDPPVTTVATELLNSIRRLAAGNACLPPSLSLSLSDTNRIHGSRRLDNVVYTNRVNLKSDQGDPNERHDTISLLKRITRTVPMLSAT